MNHVVLRPAVEEDEAFLFRVYASGREAELASNGWDEAMNIYFQPSSGCSSGPRPRPIGRT